MVDSEKVTPDGIMSLNETIQKYKGKYESYIHILNEKVKSSSVWEIQDGLIFATV